MCPPVELPVNLGKSVTPTRYNRVYTFVTLNP
jgi:hypothetical protein